MGNGCAETALTPDTITTTMPDKRNIGIRTVHYDVCHYRSK
jgi:hypothetical protein